MPPVDQLNLTTWGDAGERAILIHGSFGWGVDTWPEQRPLASSYRLLLVDRRGFGKSPADGRVDFDRDADDIAALLDQDAHLVGHSYGGVVALLAAARRPDAVRSLVVIEPPALSIVRGNPKVESFIRDIDHAARAASDPADYRRRFLEVFGFDASPPTSTAEDVEASRSSWHERPPWEAEIPLDELAAAAFPKLVVRGAWDTVQARARERGGTIFAAVCDVLEQKLGADSAVFAGAAHNPQMLGEPFNERLRAFWESA